MRGFVRLVFAVVGAAMILVSPGVFAAADGLSVARANACMGCHAVDRKLVGPSFQQIAARYKSDAGAQGKLEKKVRDGGAGAWGAIPMPSHPAMSAGDIRTVVGWVLAGAPSK
ncbi:c-type cytochrome [Paraburkholderia dinghuensis]|uniref:Cytochrome C n=1 Tax=Paraburkholderia dinghuensis TaxID=2305225 RepID=A0A3N6PPI7_9BURK|nr:cytochrome C [Paraburkholderia dinghuensis]